MQLGTEWIYSWLIMLWPSPVTQDLWMNCSTLITMTIGLGSALGNYPLMGHFWTLLHREHLHRLTQFSFVFRDKLYRPQIGVILLVCRISSQPFTDHNNNNIIHPLSMSRRHHSQTCQPLGIKNCILWSQKLYFPTKKLYFIIKTIFWGEKKYFCAQSAHHEREVLSAGVQGPKGPGSTRVLGALWCNLSLIFEHYSKTLTKFS